LDRAAFSVHSALLMRIGFSKPQLKTVHVPGVGAIVLCRNRRARRMALSVRAGRPARLTLPVGVPLSVGLEFVHSKEAWLKRTQQKVSDGENNQLPYDGTTPFNTRRHRLQVVPCKEGKLKVSIREGTIRVSYPEQMPLSAPPVQQTIIKAVGEALRIEARQDLPVRIAQLAERHGLVFRRLFIKNLISRWGSCSGCGNINLNLQLLRLPDDLIDYVILHELLHTRHPNHSPSFWRDLQAIVPSMTYQRRRLRDLARRGFLRSPLMPFES